MQISKSVCRIYFFFGLWLFLGSLCGGGLLLGVLGLRLLGLDELHELFRRLSLLYFRLSRGGRNDLVGPLDGPEGLTVAHDGLVVELKAIFALEDLDLVDVLHILHTHFGEQGVLFGLGLDSLRDILASALLLFEILKFSVEAPLYSNFSESN